MKLKGCLFLLCSSQALDHFLISVCSHHSHGTLVVTIHISYAMNHIAWPSFQHLNLCMLYTTEAKRPRNIQTQPRCCCNLLFLSSTLGGASIILFSPFVLLDNISDRIVRCPIVVPCSSKSITVTFQTRQSLKLFQIWIYTLKCTFNIALHNVSPASLQIIRLERDQGYNDQID
jgi:hypothetical protein